MYFNNVKIDSIRQFPIIFNVMPALNFRRDHPREHELESTCAPSRAFQYFEPDLTRIDVNHHRGGSTDWDLLKPISTEQLQPIENQATMRSTTVKR